MDKYVYDFVEGDKDRKDLLGGKGANLAEIPRLGLPVPPGFTVATTACRAYLATGAIPSGLFQQVGDHLRQLETRLDKRLGDPRDPLLLSVRSGGKFSMPGMMDTILDIGLNDSPPARSPGSRSSSPSRPSTARASAGSSQSPSQRDGRRGRD